jgi:hypothetical protein
MQMRRQNGSNKLQREVSVLSVLQCHPLQEKFIERFQMAARAVDVVIVPFCYLGISAAVFSVPLDSLTRGVSNKGCSLWSRNVTLTQLHSVHFMTIN